MIETKNILSVPCPICPYATCIDRALEAEAVHTDIVGGTGPTAIATACIDPQWKVLVKGSRISSTKIPPRLLYGFKPEDLLLYGAGPIASLPGLDLRLCRNELGL